MTHRRIALVMDWDDTLCPDSISGLVESLGQDPTRYWQPLDQRVQEGWDIVTAYMYGLNQLFKNRPQAEDTMVRFAQKHRCFPGTSDLVDRCRSHLQNHFGSAVEVECYILSSGLDTLIAHHPLRASFDHHWASSFHFEKGEIAFPKTILNFSDKLRCLVQIHKGLSRKLPLEVNRKIPKQERAIPYGSMIYIGDGYTDIPCFSRLSAKGGQCLAVTPPNRDPQNPLGRQLLAEGRVDAIAPTDYREGQLAWLWLEKALLQAAEVSLRD